MSRLLLDTHVLLWLLAGDRARIPALAREALENVDHDVLLSAVCHWEIAIKASLGKLEMPEGWSRAAQRLGFRPCPITSEHAVAVEHLDAHHRDPFDRLLVAQAQVEGASLVTADRRLAAYDVPIVWD